MKSTNRKLLEAMAKLSETIDSYNSFYALSEGLVEHSAKHQVVSHDIRAMFSELATKVITVYTSKDGYERAQRGQLFYFSLEKNLYNDTSIPFEITLYEAYQCEEVAVAFRLDPSKCKPNWN